METYEILNQVGSGSYGSVFRAMHKKTGKIVAIKKLKDKFYSKEECMNLAEVKSLIRMKGHPNVVEFIGLMGEHGFLYLVFEYMDHSLCRLITSAMGPKPFSEEQVKFWCFQMFQGLSHVHQCGYFHRDLKPENLLVSKDGDIKIADFGLAREVDSERPITQFVGTLWYVSPEVLLGSNNYGPAVDMWAMGAIMAELFMLRPLFPGSSPAHQMHTICSIIGSPVRIEWPEGFALASATGYQFPQFTEGKVAQLMPPGVSEHAIHLIYSLCLWDPSKRPTAADALQHPFFRSKAPSVAKPQPCSGACVPRSYKKPQFATRFPPPGFA